MTEPRARAARHKGQQNFYSDLKALLYAYGDDREPLPETIKVLDEIVTDYIIETAHSAASSATYSRRAKIKVDDFKFALRKDPSKLGRVQELLEMDKELKKARQAFNPEDDKFAAVGLVGKGDKGGEVKEGAKEGKGKD
ncbi:MAG: Transcription initiation factor TFIID subunit 13 [Pycnora praestabilis]|nr:MAG: Transcription initiation factor TFIID subunit 13 [Pycnora praestabilis]